MRAHYLHRAAILLGLAAVLAACGAGVTPAPATPTPAATPAPTAAPSSSADAICADAAAFRTSVQALKDLKPIEVGTSGVKAALADVESSAQALVMSGKDLLGPPLVDLVTAIDGLRTTLTTLGDQEGLGSVIVAVRASIAEITTAAAAVEETLDVTCPAN